MVLGLRCAVDLPELRLAGDECLDDQLVDALLQGSDVIASRLQYAVDLRQASLVAAARAPLVLVLPELVRELVDGVIRQVHEVVAQVLRVWQLVRNCREAGEALLVDVYAQRVDAIHEHVDAQVELESVDKEGV